MDLIINGIPLLALILGLVEFLKRLGLSGKGCLVASMLLGLLAGTAYQLSISPSLESSALGWIGGGWGVGSWLSSIATGLALGLSASGLYDLSRNLANHKSL